MKSTFSSAVAAWRGCGTVLAVALAVWGSALQSAHAVQAPIAHGSHGGRALAPTSVPSAVTGPIDFDAYTWAQLLKNGPKPAAYVFTNSFCPNCPETFSVLHKAVLAAGKPVPMSAILMDVQGERALAHAHHYAGVSSIYAFDGFAPAIRQAIDDKWRNVTPYVVMVNRRGNLQRVTGQPNAQQLKAWLQ